MPQQQFLIIDARGRISAEFENLVRDISTVSIFGTFESYCKKESLEFDAKALHRVQKLIENQLLDQLEILSYSHYRLLHETSEWGNAGEYQVQSSFARKVLSIPVNEPLPWDWQSQLESHLEDKYDQLDLKKKTIPEIKAYLQSPSFKLLGTPFLVREFAKINSVLSFLGLTKRFYSGQLGKMPFYIYGECETRKVHRETLYIFENELFRSPGAIVAMVALNAAQNTVIRKEAIASVFHQKWPMHFDLVLRDGFYLSYDQPRNISEGIKKLVFRSYSVESKEALNLKEKLFVKDMSQNILCHELGHSIVENEVLPLHVTALAIGSEFYGQTIYSTLNECLADFAPTTHGKLKGVYANFIQIAKKDPKKAEGLFWMYASDTWFFDTPDEYMYSYSSIVALFNLRYIKEGYRIDWEKLELDLTSSFSSTKSLSEKVSVIDQLLALYTDSINQLKLLAESLKFQFLFGGEEGFSYAKKMVDINFKNEKFLVDEKSTWYLKRFWSNFFSVDKHFGLTPKRIPEFIESEEKRLMDTLFKILAGQDQYDEFHGDYKSYIMHRMESLNIVAFQK